jgi:DNA-binding transcriptional ArsR family regulator
MQEQYPHPDLAELVLADVLQALSDPLRLHILAALAKGGERGWGDFDVAVAPSTLSHHMKVLRQAGLVAHRREGTRCWVSLRAGFDQRFPGLLATVLRLAEPAA